MTCDVCQHMNRKLTTGTVTAISVLPENCPMGQNSADDNCPRIKID